MSSAQPGSWQDKLQQYCNANKFGPPVYNIVSDRRGGRTAWSSTVTVQNRNLPARYWYDGQYLNNAKEDAAEVAYKQFIGQPTPTSTYIPAGQFKN
ncbi:hypothetical protein ASPWEDRAFT_174603 [Aspergillus wentii DTO 134E9]|uniref:DRBM domain-containing protein n=1 Tax=Aspergillus wentii DTO 134E9 TaxID=1073089 RepID=A0A1L9RE36_ASPWE|nr:uncharacterized protein ASPWEDRAFT_174603 [Aspergillus wentii DTO 134E9]KAI9933442.1 hypothetical protein MW887_007915 [Aspergillus wentii]OJJ33181.1 hypothetical protein ASPWEDRAFT_174603 [Aspergillus wentii DTO 134E9]